MGIAADAFEGQRLGMKFKAVCVLVLASVAMLARSDVLDDFERSLIAGDYSKAKGYVDKLSTSESPQHVRGYRELVRTFESCEAFISLADQYMIQPSSTPVKKLETAYAAIGFKESDFAVSNAVLDLLNERVQRAQQMMEFVHRAPSSENLVASAKEAQEQEQAVKTTCGMDYRNLKLGMTLDRVRACVGTPYLMSVSYRRGMLTQVYKVDQRYVQVMGYQVIGWVK